MPLTRRTLLGLLAVSLASPAAAFDTTWGSPGENPGGQPPDGEVVDYMRLRLRDNRTFAARNALVLTDEGAWFGSLRRKTVVRDENKIGIVRDIPLVGELFSERLRAKDFDPALRIGLVHRQDETLVVDLHQGERSLQSLAAALLSGSGRPTASLAMPGYGGDRVVPRSLIAANQLVSYHVPAAVLAGVDPAQPPAALTALARSGAGEAIGEAYRHAEGHLLTLVRPSILTGWS